jgi:hypothetical protein
VSAVAYTRLQTSAPASLGEKIVPAVLDLGHDQGIV